MLQWRAPETHTVAQLHYVHNKRRLPANHVAGGTGAALCRGAIAGFDRQWLPVWHRAAGEKSVFVATDNSGAVAVLDMQEDLAAYCDSLDTRGVRESALHAALQATLPSLTRRSAAAKAVAREVC